MMKRTLLLIIVLALAVRRDGRRKNPGTKSPSREAASSAKRQPALASATSPRTPVD